MSILRNKYTTINLVMQAFVDLFDYFFSQFISLNYMRLYIILKKYAIQFLKKALKLPRNQIFPIPLFAQNSTLKIRRINITIPNILYRKLTSS
jgi:hypothetical protein